MSIKANRRQILALGASLAFSPAISKVAAAWDREFEAFVKFGMAKTQTPGLAIAVVRKGRTVIARGYGYANIAARRRVTPDTAFHIASVSKTVTGAAMMMLWQDGRFQLDEPINKYLDFQVAHPSFPNAAITFRHLMTHSSSISDCVYSRVGTFDFAGGPERQLRDFLIEYLTPGGEFYQADGCFSSAPPGTKRKYSNVAVGLLGHLAGQIGPTLRHLTRKCLFRPLKMTTTSWTYAGLPPWKVATPYKDTTPLPVVDYPDWPAGLLRTSANDFARFLALFTTGGTLDGHRYLRPDTLKTILSPASTALPSPEDPDMQQGLIWELRRYGEHQVAVHNGSDPGASTIAVVDLERQTAALVFANSKSFGKFRMEIAIRLLDLT